MEPLAVLRVLLSLAGALIIVFILWQLDKPQVLSFQAPNFTISPNTEEFKIRITLSSTYFRSRGRLYATMSSPFVGSFVRFSLNMSLDGVDWLEVPPRIEPPTPDNKTSYTYLGHVDLSQAAVVIQGRYLVPPQTLLPTNATKNAILSSFKGSVLVEPVLMPKDYVLLLLSFVALFNMLLAVLNAAFPSATY